MNFETFHNARRLIINKFGRLWAKISLSVSLTFGAFIAWFWPALFAPFLVMGILFIIFLVALIFLVVYTIGLNIKDSLVRSGLTRRLKVLTILILLFVPFGVTLPSGTQNYDFIDYEGLLKKLQGLDTLGIDSEHYREVMGWRESQDNYRAVNKHGYLGKYQFGRVTLEGLRRHKLLEITDKQIQTFIEHPELQEKAMDALIVYNDSYFRKQGCYKYLGKGITKEGMLAAAHLVGPNAVRRYLKTGKLDKSMVDANGVTIKDYLNLF